MSRLQEKKFAHPKIYSLLRSHLLPTLFAIPTSVTKRLALLFYLGSSLGRILALETQLQEGLNFGQKIYLKKKPYSHFAQQVVNFFYFSWTGVAPSFACL